MGVGKMKREILRRMHELLSFGWCQNIFAQNADGRSVMIQDPAACQWCFGGALRLALIEKHKGGAELEVGYDPLSEEGRLRGWCVSFLSELESLGGWNDDRARTQAEVLAFVELLLTFADE
jgi:hypothetical protein